MAYNILPGRFESFQLSASCVPGNLAVSYDAAGRCNGYAIAHGSQVITAKHERDATKHTTIDPFPKSADIDSLTFVTGIKWCELSHTSVLVITSFAGFVVMTGDGSKRLFQYRLTHSDHSKVGCCARGITNTSTAICIGTSSGHILIFTVRESKEVEFHQQLNIHVKATGDEVPITCLSADEDGRLASGNERGGVIIWRDPSASRTQEILAFIRCDDQTSCIQLGWLRDLIAIGYDNGKVSICTSGGMRLTTINAHSRSIMDVDIATDTGLMLTVSEDSTFSVWKIAGNKQLKVTLVHTGVVSNSLLIGGKFCDNEGTTFGLSSYDSTNIIEYTMS